MDLLSAALAGLGLYGLSGLYLDPRSWRAAFPGALLLIASLPLGHFANTYLGFPARVATADTVQRLLMQLGVASLSTDSVLQLETGAMNVDLPCSGIRSAWTGLVLTALVRLFAVRAMNPAMVALATVVAVSALLYGIHLLRPTPSTRAIAVGRLLGHGASAALALYLAAWATFYAIPAWPWWRARCPNWPGRSSANPGSSCSPRWR